MTNEQLAALLRSYMDSLHNIYAHMKRKLEEDYSENDMLNILAELNDFIDVLDDTTDNLEKSDT